MQGPAPCFFVNLDTWEHRTFYEWIETPDDIAAKIKEIEGVGPNDCKSIFKLAKDYDDDDDDDDDDDYDDYEICDLLPVFGDANSKNTCH